MCYTQFVMDNEHFEIERKFIIRRPDPAYLEANGVPSEILQTHLISSPGEPENGASSRNIPMRLRFIKTRVNAMRQIEREWELTETEYDAFLENADPERRPIRKQRWVVEYRGQRFEIDLYPFWKKQAYLELELRSETQVIDFPPELDVIREGTGDSRYTNRALAREIPDEEE